MNLLFIKTSAGIKSCLEDTSDILVTIYARIEGEKLVQSCGSYVLERVSKFDSWRNLNEIDWSVEEDACIR
jgi:hypothetical protein